MAECLRTFGMRRDYRRSPGSGLAFRIPVPSRGWAARWQQRIGDGTQQRQQVHCFLCKRTPAWMDHVEIAAQGLRVHDLDRNKLALAEFLRQRDLRQKTEAELALDHALGGLDCFNFED